MIGATTTWTDLIREDLPDWFRAMKLAAKEVGGVQIQNAGTIVGNVCNASPAADGAPGLLALDASVVLASLSGERIIPITEFVLEIDAPPANRMKSSSAFVSQNAGKTLRALF